MRNNNETNKINIEDIPIEILIHILSFVMYTEEIKEILNDDKHSMLITMEVNYTVE